MTFRPEESLYKCNVMKKFNHASDNAKFAGAILPVIKETFPLSRIISVKMIGDVFRVAFLRMRLRPHSGILQSYIVLKDGVMLFSEN